MISFTHYYLFIFTHIQISFTQLLDKSKWIEEEEKWLIPSLKRHHTTNPDRNDSPAPGSSSFLPALPGVTGKNESRAQSQQGARDRVGGNNSTNTVNIGGMPSVVQNSSTNNSGRNQVPSSSSSSSYTNSNSNYLTTLPAIGGVASLGGSNQRGDQRTPITDPVEGGRIGMVRPGSKQLQSRPSTGNRHLIPPIASSQYPNAPIPGSGSGSTNVNNSELLNTDFKDFFHSNSTTVVGEDLQDKKKKKKSKKKKLKVGNIRIIYYTV